MDSHPTTLALSWKGEPSILRIFHLKMGQRFLISQLILEPPESVYEAKRHYYPQKQRFVQACP